MKDDIEKERSRIESAMSWENMRENEFKIVSGMFDEELDEAITGEHQPADEERKLTVLRNFGLTVAVNLLTLASKMEGDQTVFVAAVRLLQPMVKNPDVALGMAQYFVIVQGVVKALDVLEQPALSHAVSVMYRMVTEGMGPLAIEVGLVGPPVSVLSSAEIH
jgi:hypothetical protein